MYIAELWWILPLLMMALCFFMMRGRMGMMCGPGHSGEDSRDVRGSDSAKDILDNLYVLGKISREEYEEKCAVLLRSGRDSAEPHN